MTIDEIRQRVKEQPNLVEKSRSEGLEPSEQLRVMRFGEYEIAHTLLAEIDRLNETVKTCQRRIQELTKDNTYMLGYIVEKENLPALANEELATAKAEVDRLEGLLHVVSGTRDVLMAENKVLNNRLEAKQND